MLKTSLLTCITLIAFAANSLLNRMALGDGAIDAASFMAIRLISGAVLLWLLTAVVGRRSHNPSTTTLPQSPVGGFVGRWLAAFLLFLYAATFSFSYLQLAAGMGALILFGTVQVTMILVALWQGEKPKLGEWMGLLMALGGLVYLVSPGLSAPPLLGSGLMAIAGVAWGFYSILGRGSVDPIVNTTTNFVRSVPFALGVALVSLPHLHLSTQGLTLAIISGAVTSGLGYSLWYAALKGLTATQAAMVQLAVPVLASLGGVLFLQEALSLRLAIASLVILGGIGLAMLGRQR